MRRKTYALLCTDSAKGKKDQQDKGNKRSFLQGKTSQPDSGVHDVCASTTAGSPQQKLLHR